MLETKAMLARRIWTLIRTNRKASTIALGIIVFFPALWLFANLLSHRSSDDHRLKASKDSGPVVIQLNETQLTAVKLEKVSLQEFEQTRRSVGTIEFNQNKLVTVFPHYQGRILVARPNLGDFVKEGDILFTIQSPDLLAAVSNLITLSGTSTLQRKNLERAKTLVKSNAISQQQADQVISDQQSAEGSMKIARDNVRTFGKSDAEIDKIIAERRSDPELIVTSPITGIVADRNAEPGTWVQPGVAPAPYSIADTSTMWMVANVVENDAPLLKVGQVITASVAAYPDRIFTGKIIVIGTDIDPNTRRVFARCEIADPDHLLRAGMFAKFTIQISDPIRSAAMNQNGVVRESNGNISAWVTTDHKHFTRRLIQVGQRQGGLVQILSGIELGDEVVSDGAIFLSNQVSINALD
jgi:cobalt-zinc-cadmium efflux system membrane fusion protein